MEAASGNSVDSAPAPKEDTFHTPLRRVEDSSHTPDHAHNPASVTPVAAEGGERAGEGGSAVKEKKYSVKARLFVGNLPRDSTQEMVRAMFAEFGEVKEVFVHTEKSFGFVRMVSPCKWQVDFCGGGGGESRSDDLW